MIQNTLKHGWLTNMFQQNLGGEAVVDFVPKVIDLSEGGGMGEGVVHPAQTGWGRCGPPNSGWGGEGVVHPVQTGW